MSPTATPPTPISWVETFTGVPPPTALGRDLERVGLAHGFSAEVEQLEGDAPELFTAAAAGPAPGPGGEIVFVLESGWVAPRDQLMLNIPILSIDRGYASNDEWAWELVDRTSPGWRSPARVEIDYWLTVAVPTMGQPVGGPVTAVRLSATTDAAASQPADDLSRRAAATFEAERGQILFKTLLRALVKYGASRVAANENSTAGAIVNLLGVLTERADTRCWLTLPDRLSVARLHLPPGRHELRVDYLDGSGVVVLSEIEIVEVVDGGWIFLNRRSFS